MKTDINTAKATSKQLALLSRWGYVGDLEALTVTQASEAIERLKAQRHAQIEAAKRHAATINLIDLAGRYVELRKVSPKEHHGPCPWCGGDDRFRVTADHFACRPGGAGHCGRSGDAIEFIMQKQNVDFDEAVSILGGNMPVVAEKIKPVSKPAESAYEWDEAKHKKLVMESHVNLVAARTKYAWQCMEYLQARGIKPDTIKAFGIGYTAWQLPGTWDNDGKKFVYPKQLAISLPWFNHDGALVAVKFRFIESHTYTGVDKKEHTENKTSRGQVAGNCFGWQALKGADKCKVLIICEGEINALSLWQAGRGAVDVLSTGSEATTKVLPRIAVEIAHRYAHRIVWADNKAIADAAALQIKAASMASPGGKDANDLLQAGKLGTLLTAMLGRLGVTLPAEPVANESHTDCTPSLHTDVLLAKGDALRSMTTEEKAQVLPTYGDSLLIKDAKPFEFPVDAEPINQVATLAERLRQVAELPSFDERLDELEPLHGLIGSLSYDDLRDASITQELQKIFKKPSTVDAFLNKYGKSKPVEPGPLPTVGAVDDLPNIHTADIYAFVGLNLWPDELAILRERCAQRLDVVTVEDGQTHRVTMLHRTGAQLWQAPSGGHYVIS